MRIIGVIPARFASSRFPGKPLAKIAGVEMIKRVYKRARLCEAMEDLLVATDDTRILEFCQKENIPALRTDSSHLTGTDRLSEVANKIQADLYINIQGDEPVINPRGIEEIISEYQHYKDSYIAYNLYKKIPLDEAKMPTIIKMIVNHKDELLYASRALIPYSKGKSVESYKKQVCIYGFSYEALKLFSKGQKTANEAIEDIEILRFLDRGFKIKMRETKIDSISVDVLDDVARVESFLRSQQERFML